MMCDFTKAQIYQCNLLRKKKHKTQVKGRSRMCECVVKSIFLIGFLINNPSWKKNRKQMKKKTFSFYLRCCNPKSQSVQSGGFVHRKSAR